MTENIRLGPLENRLIFTLEEKGKRLFGFSDARKILRTSHSSVANVLYRLKRKNRIKEIEKGKYVLSPAISGLEGYWSEDIFLVVDNLIDEYYIAFWSAMNYWDMTEQIPYTLFVATTKRKRDVEYSGQKIKFIFLAQNKFFGYIRKKIEKGTFAISSREKTILDGLSHPEYCGGLSEVAKSIWNSKDYLNWNKLLDFLKILDVSAVNRRLGYLLDVLDVKKDVQDKILQPFSGFVWLDPSSEKECIMYSKRWGLKINVSIKKLLEWRGY